MVSILPFVGTRYNTQLIQDVKLVLAPYYDSISKEEQKLFYQAHQNNAIRLILGAPKPGDDEYNNKYTRSANYIQSWKRDGVFVDDDKKSFYIYERKFKLPDGTEKTQTGLFALLKLEDAKSGNIISHTKISSKVRTDGLRLIRLTRSNLNPIFTLYSDPENKIDNILQEKMKSKSWLEVEDFSNIKHRLWVVSKKDFAAEMMAQFQDKKIFIADGHYLYETALQYQKEMREATGKKDGNQPFDYIMVYLTNFENPGLVVLPNHRVISNDLGAGVDGQEILADLKEYFNIDKIDIDTNNVLGSAQKIIAKLEEKGKISTSFAMIMPKAKANLLSLKPKIRFNDIIEKEMPEDIKNLDVSILHDYIISQIWVGNPEYEIEDEDIRYTKDPTIAINMVQNKKASVAFLMNPMKLEQINQISNKGFSLPQRAISFYPKLITGILLRDMTNKW